MTAIRQDLPGLDGRLKYMSTGNLAARLKMEGEQSEFDIALGVEAGYLRSAEDALVPLTSRYDLSVFEDDLLISDKIMSLTRECGCFAHNTEVLARAGIAGPPAWTTSSAHASQASPPCPTPRPRARATTSTTPW